MESTGNENYDRIPAIETRYKGFRFRSRLEARYAVVFDHLDIPWSYEPQGLLPSRRITGWWGDDRFPYLPDFLLSPKYGQPVYAEVKGAFTSSRMMRDLVDAAASLSSNDGTGCHHDGGTDLVLFGPLGYPGVPSVLHMCYGALCASCWLCGPHGQMQELGNDSGEVHEAQVVRLLMGMDCDQGHMGWWKRATSAGTMARFEHGESGS